MGFLKFPFLFELPNSDLFCSEQKEEKTVGQCPMMGHFAG